MYGVIDGSHHKEWLLDQIARIIKGTKVIVRLAKWDNGHEEFRFELEASMREGDDGANTYDYSVGIAP